MGPPLSRVVGKQDWRWTPHRVLQQRLSIPTIVVHPVTIRPLYLGLFHEVRFGSFMSFGLHQRYVRVGAISDMMVRWGSASNCLPAGVRTKLLAVPNGTKPASLLPHPSGLINRSGGEIHSWPGNMLVQRRFRHAELCRDLTDRQIAVF